MKTHVFQIITLSIVLTGTGCQSGDPVTLEQDYGNSVRQMVRSQIYDWDVARAPHPEPPLTLDGVKASNSLDSYREDIGKPESTEQPVLINIESGN